MERGSTTHLRKSTLGMKLPEVMRKVQKYPGAMWLTGTHARVIVPITTSTGEVSLLELAGGKLLTVGEHRVACALAVVVG